MHDPLVLYRVVQLNSAEVWGGGSVGRGRTYDIWINSPLFYH